MHPRGKEESLRAGYAAGRRGRPLQPGMGADWRHGWDIGRRDATAARKQRAREGDAAGDLSKLRPMEAFSA